MYQVYSVMERIFKEIVLDLRSEKGIEISKTSGGQIQAEGRVCTGTSRMRVASVAEVQKVSD